MKKTLVAIAAVVATTGAMAEATITGSIQAGTNQTSSITTGGAASNALYVGDANGNTALQIGVSEDLGDGMKVFGNIGIELDNGGSTGSNYGNHGVNETYLALSGAFGTLKTGALQTPQFLVIANGDAGGGYLVGNTVASLTQHQGGTVGSTTLIQANSFQYTLPTIVEGLSLKYQTALGELTTDLSGSQHYAADFKSGGLTAGVAYSNYKYTAALEDTATAYYATYNFGPATLKTLFGTANTGGASTVSGSSVGVSVPMGAATFMYNHGTSNGVVLNGVAGATARTVSTVGQSGDFLGMSYSLSKRTTAFAVYYKESGNNGSGTAYTADSSSSWNTTRFIVIHSF